MKWRVAPVFAASSSSQGRAAGSAVAWIAGGQGSATFGEPRFGSRGATRGSLVEAKRASRQSLEGGCVGFRSERDSKPSKKVYRLRPGSAGHLDLIEQGGQRVLERQTLITF